MTWWIWVVLGFGCLLFELSFPLFVLIWFGIAALFMAGVCFVAPDVDLALQLFLWIILSISMLSIWWVFFKKNLHKTHSGLSSAQIIGEEGIIVDMSAPFRNGKVRFQKPIFGADTWSCVSEEECPVGMRVKVLSIDGSFVTVGKKGEETCQASK